MQGMMWLCAAALCVLTAGASGQDAANNTEPACAGEAHYTPCAPHPDTGDCERVGVYSAVAPDATEPCTVTESCQEEACDLARKKTSKKAARAERRRSRKSGVDTPPAAAEGGENELVRRGKRLKVSKKSGCKYIRNETSKCISGERNITLTLVETGEPSCPPTKSITRKCRDKPARGCHYRESVRTACTEGATQITITESLVKGGDSCEPTFIRTKLCGARGKAGKAGQCRYTFSEWTDCEDRVRTREGVLNDGAATTCAHNKTLTKPCKHGHGCKYDLGEWSACTADTPNKQRQDALRAGGAHCEEMRTLEKPCKVKPAKLARLAEKAAIQEITASQQEQQTDRLEQRVNKHTLKAQKKQKKASLQAQKALKHEHKAQKLAQKAVELDTNQHNKEEKRQRKIARKAERKQQRQVARREQMAEGGAVERTHNRTESARRHKGSDQIRQEE